MSALGEPRNKPLCDHGLMRSYCTDCKNEYARVWVDENREKAREYGRRYRRNKRLTPEGKAHDNEVGRKYHHGRGQFRRYGITEDDFKAMLIYQGNKCAICREEFIVGQRGRINIDHDSRDPVLQPRGLLCFSCNVGLGKFRDDPDTLVRAAAYIRESPFLRAVGEDRIPSRKEAG